MSSYASVCLNNPKAVDIVGIAVDDKIGLAAITQW